MISAKILFHGIFIGLLAFAGLAEAAAQSKKIYVIEIANEVDRGMSPYVRRVLAEAAEEKAAAVLLHVHTLGGEVSVASDIKEAVINSGMPVLAYVNPQAISAGAYIALLAKKIAMAPGATMGAVTPVYATGERASEKVVSFMRSEMRATAERNGRDPRIAEAMVDEGVTLSDTTLKKEGQILTLTSSEAMKVGYCDAVASTMTEALAKLGYPDAEIVETDYGWSELLVRFLTKPVMNSILIMLGLGGIFFTVKTGHFSSITGVGIVAITLFFGAQYMADMATFIEVVMFAAGVVLILVEVFVVPGFGVTGISGAVLLVSSLFLSLISNFNLLSMDSLGTPLYTLAASFVGLAILVALMVRYLPQSSAFNRFVLTASQPASAGFVSAPDYGELLGFSGAAITTLRPAGLAQIGTDRYDVITEGEYIQAGEPLKVIRVEGRKIVVRKA
jgi:membrane-bound serine protease (ClpP class)